MICLHILFIPNTYLLYYICDVCEYVHTSQVLDVTYFTTALINHLQVPGRLKTKQSANK